MRVLAIETSCDETGVAIVDGEKTPNGFVFRVLGSALLSQAELHAPYGGVFPTLAKREHEKNLPIILEQALRAVSTSSDNSSEKGPRVSPLADNLPVGEAGPDSFSSEFSSLVIEQLKSLKINAIAVTNGPGLEPALWTGIVFAKQLAKETGLPLMGVNHMEGHLLSSLAHRSIGEGGPQKHSQILENMRIEYRLEDVQFPVLGLLISGGHTEFVLMKDWFEYEIVGKTLDDAVGEAFDKVARLLDLPYPGGPQISKLADQHRQAEQKTLEKSPGGGVPLFKGAKRLLKSGAKDFSKEFSVELPRPMLTSKNCDMSFSGLKTAALYALRKAQDELPRKLSDEEKQAFAREFEDAVGDVFVTKTRKALIETEAKTFVIGGGVAANRYLRERLQSLVLKEFGDPSSEQGIELRLPDLTITGDNATMIAEAALTHLLTHGIPHDQSEGLRAEGSLSLDTSH